MVEEYEEIADPLDRPEDQDGDQDDHLGERRDSSSTVA